MSSPGNRASPKSAAQAEDSHLTYDEVSMERSRHFTMALQELKNLRPQLYSAAEYFESSYTISDQKQVVLENLKEYSVKALVNAVDHLGTVAYKLNDLLAQENTELAIIQMQCDSLSQRLRSCQEHSDREGMKQQSLIRTCPRNYSHYVLGDPLAEERIHAAPDTFSQAFDPEQLHPVPSEQMPAGAKDSRSLLWHLASEPFLNQSNRGSHPPSSAWNGKPESIPTRVLASDDTSNQTTLPNFAPPSVPNRPKFASRSISMPAASSLGSSSGVNATAEEQLRTPISNREELRNREQHHSSRGFLMSLLSRRSKQI